MRGLSTELKQIAESELNEVQARVDDDIVHLENWLKKQPHINARQEKQWLMTFLRGCKFSLERTKEKIDMYYTVRSLAPEYFRERNPFSPGIQRLLEIGTCLPLPKLSHPGAPRVILMRPGVYDPSKTTLEDVFKLYLMIHDILLWEDDNFIIAGEYIFEDMKDVGVAHIKLISPTLMKKAMTCFQQAYPLRVKGIHFINTFSGFETFYNLIKPFVSEKIKNRMCVYSKNNMNELYRIFPVSILPEEYGGEGGKLADITAQWKQKVESYESWFKEDSKYKTHEEKRIGETKTSENVFGLEGSFRSLNVD